ncbi:hypothetical protein [Photobacterium leiognathi]|uniref:hypothetical protein n=1 Tax=Photobacterium leiognathi TaxID=553611 RepID=UPI002981B609|nr:hypothetical protein [Photobacterium leiognathi]
MSFRELCDCIYKGRRIYLFTTVVVLFLTLIFIYITPTLWGTKYVVKKPSQSQNFNYKQYLGSIKEFLSKEQYEKLNSSNAIFYLFNASYNSDINKREFFEKKQNGIDVNKKNLSLISSTENRDKKYYTLSFVSESDKNIINDTIAYEKLISEKLNFQLNSEIENILNIKLKELEGERELLVESAKFKKEIERNKLEMSYQVALSAKQVSPINTANKSDSFININLGSDGLRRALVELSDNSKLSIYEPELVLIDSKINSLKRIKEEELKVNFFKAVSSPQYNIEKLTPKVPLLIIISIFFSFVISTGLVILRKIFNEDF